MHKVTSTIAVLGMSVGMVAAVGAAPASAAACAAYPPGSAYKVDVTPLSQTVRKGASVLVKVRAHRGSTNCPGQKVYFQFAKPGQHFHAFRTRVTDRNGVATQLYTIPNTLVVRVVWPPTRTTTVQSNHPVYTVARR